MKDTQPITPTTVRPLRVLTAIAVSVVVLAIATILFEEASYRYKLWRANGIWCATLSPDGTVTKLYGAEKCGY